MVQLSGQGGTCSLPHSGVVNERSARGCLDLLDIFVNSFAHPRAVGIPIWSWRSTKKVAPWHELSCTCVNGA